MMLCSDKLAGSLVRVDCIASLIRVHDCKTDTGWSHSLPKYNNLYTLYSREGLTFVVYYTVEVVVIYIRAESRTRQKSMGVLNRSGYYLKKC